METFSALLAFVYGIHRSTVNSPHKGQWRGDLVFSLICAWINDWVNNRKTGDLKSHRAHYDVTVMYVPNYAYAFRNSIMNKYHGLFLRDSYPSLNCAFPRFLWTWTIKYDFRSTFLYWYGEIHTLIPKIHNFYTDSCIWITIHHTVRYTNQVLESIVPLSWSKQLDDDEAYFVHEYSSYVANS